MKILPRVVEFDWDIGNIEKNLTNHNVTNKEAEEIFKNVPLFISQDTKHSKYEKRFQALGKTNNKRLLFLSFTLRENKIRVISVRDMSKKEVKTYEEI